MSTKLKWYDRVTFTILIMVLLLMMYITKGESSGFLSFKEILVFVLGVWSRDITGLMMAPNQTNNIKADTVNPSVDTKEIKSDDKEIKA